MAHHGAFLILDEVLLNGGAGQERLQATLGRSGRAVGGCSLRPLVASDREATRPGRVRGMAMKQAAAVHAGVVYDVEVDTTGCSAAACARRIAEDVTCH